jgi:hypothetical protein
VALAALVRAGILHIGGGIELTVSPTGWSQDGPAFRLAPMIIGDAMTCAGFGDPAPGQPYCSRAVFLVGELAAQYRWRLGRSLALSIGAAGNVGVQRLSGMWGSTTAPAYGFVLPQVRLEF